MKRSRLLAATFALGVFLGAGPLAAQKASRGHDAIVAGNYKEAISIFRTLTQTVKGVEWGSHSFYLGFALFQDRQVPEAAAVFKALFDHVYKMKSNTWGFLPAWHFWRGRAEYGLGHYQEAAVSFAEAVKIAPETIPPDFWPQDRLRVLQPKKEHCYSWLGDSQLRFGAFQEAVGSFKMAVERDPKNADYYRNLSRAYSGLKQYDEALTAAKRSVELEPTASSYRALGDVHLAQKRYDEAIAAYEKGAAAAPSNPDIPMGLGRALVAKQDYGGAVKAFTRASELAPNNASVLSWLADALSRAGQFDEAIAALDKLIGIVTYAGIGITTKVENEVPVVQRDVEGETGLVDGPAKEAGVMAGDRLIKIDGQLTKGWDQNKISRNLRGAENASVVLTIERPGLAEPFDRTIVRKRIIPKAAASNFGLRSLIFREKGDRDRAAEDAALAYSLDPDAVDARQSLAAVDIDLGKYEEALRLLSTLKDNPFVRILEATAYAKKGDIPRAVEAYTGVPGADLATTALRRNARAALLSSLQGYVQQRLEKAGASESLGRFLEAMAEYTEAAKIADEATTASIRQRVGILLKAHPYLAELGEEARKHALRGDVLIKDGAFAEALAEYRTAVRLAPLNPKLHFNTALICGELKGYREAISSMNAYLQLSPDAENARAAKDEIYKWEFQLEEQGKKKEA